MRRNALLLLCGWLLAVPARGVVLTKVEVLPSRPTTGDEVRIRLQWNGGNRCTTRLGAVGEAFLLGVPTGAAAGLDELTNIVIAAGLPSGDECAGGSGAAAAAEKFTIFSDSEVFLGRLNAQEHEVRIWYRDVASNIFGPEELLGTIEFTVAPGDETLPLRGGRFLARARWRDPAGDEGPARIVPGRSDESGLFWFFRPDNWELMVKLLDGCGVNGHFWVLGSASTNVQNTLEIEDTVTGRIWEHTNPQGQLAPAFADTSAFACAAPAQ